MRFSGEKRGKPPRKIRLRIERRAAIHLAGEVTLADRSPWHEPGTEFFAGLQDAVWSPDLFQRRSIRSGWRLSAARHASADRIGTRFRKTKVQHLAFGNQLLDGSCDVLSWPPAVVAHCPLGCDDGSG